MFPWAFPAPSFMAPGTIRVITMVRDITRLDIIGDLPGMRTTGVPIGGTGTGGITAGTGIEILSGAGTQDSGVAEFGCIDNLSCFLERRRAAPETCARARFGRPFCNS